MKTRLRPTRALRTSPLLGLNAPSTDHPPQALDGEDFVALRTDAGTFWLPAADQVMRPFLQRCSTWERSTVEILRRLLRPGCRFLDVGAGFGYFSVMAAGAAPGVRVDAVEPLPQMLDLLRFNLWLNKTEAEVWPVALSEKRGALPLRTAPQNIGDTRGQEILAGEVYQMVVPAVPADELFPRVRFDVVKIDVQGWEFEVLLGMQQILRTSPGIALVVEYWPTALRERGVDPLEVLDGYGRMGLRSAVIRDDTLEDLAPAAILEMCQSGGPDGSVNLFLRFRE